MISHKKWYKGEFEVDQHICNFSDKICPLHYHHHIKSGLKCFFGGWVPLVVRLATYQTSQNAANNRNDKANANTSGTETFLSSENKRNKAKIVRWSDQ